MLENWSPIQYKYTVYICALCNHLTRYHVIPRSFEDPLFYPTINCVPPFFSCLFFVHIQATECVNTGRMTVRILSLSLLIAFVAYL